MVFSSEYQAMFVSWLMKQHLIFKLDEILKLVLTENQLQDSRSDNDSYNQKAYNTKKVACRSRTSGENVE